MKYLLSQEEIDKIMIDIKTDSGLYDISKIEKTKIDVNAILDSLEDIDTDTILDCLDDDDIISYLETYHNFTNSESIRLFQHLNINNLAELVKQELEEEDILKIGNCYAVLKFETLHDYQKFDILSKLLEKDLTILTEIETKYL